MSNSQTRTARPSLPRLPLAAAIPALLCGSLSLTPAQAQTVPPGYTLTVLASGSNLSRLTSMSIAPDGKVFMAMATGELRVWIPGPGIQTAPVHTFAVSSVGERGLLGVTVDPNYLTNGYIYVHCSRALPTIGGSIRRITIDLNSSPLASIPNSEVEVFYLGNYSTATNDNGGAVHFGPDGKLYIGAGDNISSTNSQSINNLYGKILRINPDPLNPIPSDNPTSFPGIAGSPVGNNRAIWAVGLRNPFTFAFHPTNGRLFINDVGNDLWEEINEGLAGANYGWATTEGDFNPAQFPNFTRPLLAYSHSTGPLVGRSITGGSFYHPPTHSFPAEFHNDYFFTDYTTDWIKRFDPQTGIVHDFGTGFRFLTGTEVDASGALIVLQYLVPARLVRIARTANDAPVILEAPVPTLALNGASASFSVYASGNPAPSYQWNFDNQPLTNGPTVSGANTPTLSLSALSCSNQGLYTVTITNTAGTITSQAAQLTISNAQPTITADPQDSQTCPVSDVTFTIQTAANSGETYLWEIDDPNSPSGWSPILDGPLSAGASASGALTSSLSLSGVSQLMPELNDLAAFIRCTVSNPCGSSTSSPALLTLCIGDFNCDGGIDGEDVSAFFIDWEAGAPLADVNGDGGIDGSDIEVFFARWEGGC